MYVGAGKGAIRPVRTRFRPRWDPLSPHPAEIAMSLVAVLTIAFCVYAAAQVLRGRWTAAQGFALIVLALLLPVVGPVAGLWWMQRARRGTLAQAS